MFTSRLEMQDCRTAQRHVFGAALTRSDVVAVLSFAVGAVHLVVAPEHLSAWWPAGVFFIVIGTLQVGFGVALLRGKHPVVETMGLMMNVAVVAVYVVSRTAGLGPIHDHDEHGYRNAAERVESVGVLDLTTTAVELITVAILLTLLPRRTRSLAVDALFLVGIGIWSARIFGVLR